MIKLDRFTPRDYQLDFFQAMENSGDRYKHAIIVHPRRSGKDYMTFQYALRHALRKTTTVLYMLKSYSQAKQVIWDLINNDGVKILDTIPPEVIRSLNSSELKITLNNGSIIKLGSAENYEKSIVGSNASLIIFSEYGTYDNDNPYLFASPIIAAHPGGRFIFISTPRGRNHYYDLWIKAQKWPDWYCELKTVDDTGHISKDMMEIIEREQSYEFIQQEYYCSFDRGIEGTFYAKYINKAHDEGRIGSVPYDPTLPVNTSWDLGFNNTAIIYFQIDKQNNVRIIDFSAPVNRSLHDWIKHVKEKEYVYGKHWAPHDVARHEDTTGLTRIDFARELGFNFEVREINGKIQGAIPRVSVDAGIERAQAVFNRVSFDAVKCAYLIKSLETYHRAYDIEAKVYSREPAKSWANHASDAFRYMSLVLDLHKTGMTIEEIHRGYNETMFNTTNKLDYPFDNDRPNFSNHRGF